MVKKYVILANSNDKTFNIPRQLLEINGEKLVARTIRLLRENGVEDITLTASDDRFKELDAKVYTPSSSDYNYSNGTGYWLNAFPYELLNEPVCFIWGDVYFSENAIKTIVETESNKNLFFCTYKNSYKYYMKRHDEPLAYKVVDGKIFKKHIEICKKAKDDGIAGREPIVWELYRSMHDLDINVHRMTSDFEVINDISCDIDSKNDLERLKLMIVFEKNDKEGRKYMVKLEATQEFTLARFNELKNIQRRSITPNDGRILVGDTFECEKDLADYLLGGNAKRVVVAKLVEIIPEELPKEPKKAPEKAEQEQKVEPKKQPKKVAKKRK